MSRELGQAVEAHAAAFLKEQGFTLVAQNFHAKGGEIDLIASNRDTLVFAEVRYRKTDRFGAAEESVTYQKQRRIIQTAEHFLLKHPKLQHCNCRFDVIACTPSNAGVTINWIKGAFTS